MSAKKKWELIKSWSKIKWKEHEDDILKGITIGAISIGGLLAAYTVGECVALVRYYNDPLSLYDPSGSSFNELFKDEGITEEGKLFMRKMSMMMGKYVKDMNMGETIVFQKVDSDVLKAYIGKMPIE